MTDTDTTTAEVTMTTIEQSWGIYVRVAHLSPEDEDHLSIAERAPRERAPSGEAANRVPGHEGVVLALVDADDLRQQHIRYLRREAGHWIARTWDEVMDAYDPAGIPRRAEKLADYLFNKDNWKYRPRRLAWESPVVGLHVGSDGRSRVIEKATKNFAWVRDARAPEIAAGRMLYRYGTP